MKDKARFMKLFTYEVQNRVMALNGIRRLAAKTKGQPAGPFWAAYYKLEELNQALFKPVASKHQVSMDVTFLNKILGGLWLGFATLLPTAALKNIRDQTIAYVADLEELEQLADQDDKDFFHYVVLQEKAQAEGMVLLSEGKEAAAAQVMEEFIEANTK